MTKMCEYTDLSRWRHEIKAFCERDVQRTIDSNEPTEFRQVKADSFGWKFPKLKIDNENWDSACTSKAAAEVDNYTSESVCWTVCTFQKKNITFQKGSVKAYHDMTFSSRCDSINKTKRGSSDASWNREQGKLPVAVNLIIDLRSKTFKSLLEIKSSWEPAWKATKMFFW